MATSSWVSVDEYKYPGGWVRPEDHDARARDYCRALESGEILFFPEVPFDFPAEDQSFLLAQKWAELRLHKNVSYRPGEDVLRGVTGTAETTERLHAILRAYSTQVVAFASKFLAPYADKWVLDFASFRPLEEEGRDLPLHKRNDLLHVDAFPSRPTRGGRILRIFTNVNPTRARVWNSGEKFESLANHYANDAGLQQIAQESFVSRTVQSWGQKLGLRGMGKTPYDKFMLRFHDYLKENEKYQAEGPKTRVEFPPLATWIVYTDGVPHAVLSGQYAMEQTFLIPPSALVAPEHAPYRVLETIAGRSLVA